MGGAKSSGVTVREASIRVAFTYEKKQHHKTLMLNGAPMPPSPANIKYAQRFVADIRDKIRLGVFSMAESFPETGDSGALTVSAQLDTWLEAISIKKSTRRGYGSAVNFWKETLGDKLLRALKKSDILKATKARPGLSGKTINNYMSALRDALTLAVDDEVLNGNPCDKIKPAPHQKEPPDPLTRDEAERIITHFMGRNAAHYNMVEFWFWSGLRTGELYGLRWENVDLSKGYVRIKEAIVHGERTEETKTNVVRDVWLNTRSRAAIERQRALTQLAGGPVFTDPDTAKPWGESRHDFLAPWTAALKVLGIRYRRPYNCRHTYATIMLMAGMNHSFCAAQLGHSIQMFQTTYSKWLHGAQDAVEMGKLAGVADYANPMPGKSLSVTND